MKIKEARPLIKAYYSDSGENATVIKKLEREVTCSDGYSFIEEAFLCHVTQHPDPYKKGKVTTVCTIEYDRYNKPYATEFTSGYEEKCVACAWINE